jgi:hypothetical protein
LYWWAIQLKHIFVERIERRDLFLHRAAAALRGSERLSSMSSLLSPEQVAEKVGKIRASWQKSVSGIIETGRLLAELSDGTDQWGLLFGKDAPLPMSEYTAYCLIQIARHPTLSNLEHALSLPVSWFVLFLLSKIPSDRLEALLADGSVHPGLQRAGAEVLVNREVIRRRRRVNRPSSPKRAERKKTFRNVSASRRQPGQLEDVLRELRPAVYQVQKSVGELAEGKKEIRATGTFKDEARGMMDVLQTAVDTLAGIVDDDPGAVLGNGYEERFLTAAE